MLLTVSPDEDLINFGLESDVWYDFPAIPHGLRD